MELGGPDEGGDEDDDEAGEDGERGADSDEVGELVAARAVDEQVAMVADGREEGDDGGHGDGDDVGLGRLAEGLGEARWRRGRRGR